MVTCRLYSPCKMVIISGHNVAFKSSNFRVNVQHETTVIFALDTVYHICLLDRATVSCKTKLESCCVIAVLGHVYCITQSVHHGEPMVHPAM